MCFSLPWLQAFLVWLVIVIAIYSIIKLVVPWLLSKLGGDFAILGQVLNIVLWAFVIIVCIYIIFMLISCLLSLGGGSFTLFPR